MRDILGHRGPDDAGSYVDERAALGHRRLSIVDVAAGHQPLSNEDGSIWIVFNGEIYNHADVRPGLESAGHTLPHAIRHRDHRSCLRAVGRRLRRAPARDVRVRHLGRAAPAPAARARSPRRQAALLGAGRAAACCSRSEIKSILESGLIRAEADESRLPELLSTRYLSGAETLFKGIYRLLPGHTLVFEHGRSRRASTWDIAAGRSDESLANQSPSSEAVQQFRARLEEAVRIRLMADVPLGMFLSGGLDSSAIAALMAGMIDRPLQTFSVAFKQRAFSELDYARQVSTAIRADAHEIVIDDHDFFGALPRLIWHEDEPIAHPSSVPLYFRFRARPAARQGRAHRRRQRRAARRLRQVSEGARQLARRRRLQRRAASGSRVDRRHGGAAAAAAGAPLCEPLVRLHGAHAGGDVLRQLRRHQPRPSAHAAVAAISPAPHPKTSTGRRASTSMRRTATARLSTACSMRISRPISSSC